LGGACGAAALSRSELVLLVPALLWPIAAISDAGVRRAGAATLVALGVVTPWVVFNLARFEHPVFLSSQLEPTLAGANCDDTYSGPRSALTPTCLRGLDPLADQSVNADILRTRVRNFVGDHVSRLPVVVAAPRSVTGCTGRPPRSISTSRSKAATGRLRSRSGQRLRDRARGDRRNRHPPEAARRPVFP
jgi:hypothetical protein